MPDPTNTSDETRTPAEKQPQAARDLRVQQRQSALPETDRPTAHQKQFREAQKPGKFAKSEMARQQKETRRALASEKKRAGAGKAGGSGKTPGAEKTGGLGNMAGGVGKMAGSGGMGKIAGAGKGGQAAGAVAEQAVKQISKKFFLTIIVAVAPWCGLGCLILIAAVFLLAIFSAI